MGKWSSFKESLPIFHEENHRDRIEKMKQDLRERDNTNILCMIAACKNEKQQISEREKELNLALEACTEVINSRWSEEGIESVKIEDVGRFTLAPEPYTKIINTEAIKQFIKINDFDRVNEIIRETVQWQSFNSYIKERLEKGLPLPSNEAAMVFIKESIRFTKEK